MKILSGICFLMALTACVLAPATPAAMPSPLPTPTNPWLGQTLPGAEPTRFGSGLLPNSYHSSLTFSPDGTLAYWGAAYETAKIYTSRLDNGTWTKPSIINFYAGMDSYRDPFLSPDGLRLYFISTNALPGTTTSGKENIWMMGKDGDAWGIPQPLPDSINAYDLHWTVSVAANYTLYFSAGPAMEKDIFVSRYVDGIYAEPERLGGPVNTGELEITPNIAPDESYLLFTRLPDAHSTPHLFISYKMEGGWSEPQKVENIRYCISPIVTPDRMYVIYLSSPHSLEWRDTSFIEELRP